ncbi:hypothetical protein CIG75_02680 [Tumebacillus algifaecis]|uniref:Major facilitator superfamily (MFS) profile domain-containing protein n=1 Tax=Tumebacillus algifaecis TaxID=1214604 RepID=A0A223CY04_9BACL|nr:MFS transporter [Tumebacillus algifaecis]ASS73993.1 hypothetical protein CIG75_02680 [Tumebacillus algifaecis]
MDSSSKQKSSLWSNKIFNKMFVSYTLSSVGDWFDMIAIMTLFSFVWKVEPLYVSLIPLMYAIPSIFLGQIAGVFVDRWNKVNLMIITDVIRAIFTVMLIFAPSTWWVLPLLFFRAAAGTFHAPAQQALVRHVVDKEHLLQASTLIGVVFQLAKVFGPLAGAALIAFGSIELCLIVNAVSYGISAILLLTVGKVKEQQDETEQDKEKQSFAASWKEGWSVVLTNRLLFSSTVFFLIGFAGLQIVDAQLGVLLREIDASRTELLGYMIATVAVGTLLVGATFGILKRTGISYGWLFGGASVLIGIAFYFMGSYEAGSSIAWLLVPSFIGGMGAGVAFMAYNYLRQVETPKEAMGRVTGITNSLTSVVVVVGPLGGSWLVTALGVFDAFIVAGYVVGAIGLFGILLQRLIWGAKQASGSDQDSTNRPAAV